MPREDAEVKIVSLLPSATEIVFALGLGDQLEGVSFECDYPAEARGVPIVSGTVLPVDERRDAASIDADVSALIASGEPIYTLDDARIRSISPDLILAQDLCRVCAVPSGAVEDALDVIGCSAAVVSLDPAGLDEVIGCVGQVGRATGTETQAETLMAALRTRVEAVRARVHGPARASSCSSGPIPRSTRAIGSPNRWRRQAASLCWRRPGRGRIVSSGTRSRRPRST
jgi:iron complex transport system substrate-binding protein